MNYPIVELCWEDGFKKVRYCRGIGQRSYGLALNVSDDNDNLNNQAWQPLETSKQFVIYHLADDGRHEITIDELKKLLEVK